MMFGKYRVSLELPTESWAQASVDVSMFFEGDVEVVLVGSWESDGCLSVWTKELLQEEVSRLKASVESEGDEYEANNLRQLSHPLATVRVGGGILHLTAESLGVLGCSAGDDAIAVGCGDHIELWNQQWWDAMHEAAEDDLERMLTDSC